MRRLGHLLFFVWAVAALMWGAQTARAEERPIAVCKEGKCVMSEEDFKALQEFIKATHAAAQRNNEIETAINEKLNELSGALENCKDRQRKWKS